MVVAQIGDQLRADDASETPGGQHGAGDAGQALRAEGIGHKRGQSAKAAAVAQQDVAHDHSKNPGVFHLAQQQESQALAGQHGAKHGDAPDAVRQAAPEKSANAIEQGADGNERGTAGGQLGATESRVLAAQ